VIANMNQNRIDRIDVTRRYTLAPGIRVIRRAPDEVQIGTDPPRCVVVRHAPDDSLQVLAGLDGASTVAEVLIAHDGDPLVWTSLLDQLMAAGLLLPAGESDRTGPAMVVGAHLADERSGLTHRHGDAAAGRILQARDDALVVVRGVSIVAFSVASLLAAAGVGHIHHESDRPSPPTLSTGAPPRPGSAGQRATPGTSTLALFDMGAGLREKYPTVRVHPPAAHQRPTIVVMAGDAVPDLTLAATYTRNRITHLSVSAGVARTVVGPLVLPGRSSCLSCAHRHRTDADPGWPAIARAMDGGHQRAPTFLAAAAAALAVGQVLEHIDGVAIPGTVNGTLEWRSGDPAPRRRTWVGHPKCGCRGDS